MTKNHVVISPGHAPAETPLARALEQALATGEFGSLAAIEPRNRADATATLLSIYNLWLGTLPSADARERFQNEPSVAALKWRLEAAFLEQLEGSPAPDAITTMDAAAALRRIAARDDNAVYDWLATSATWDQLLRFLAIEGGPDGGFDDLVAICQVGLSGEPKLVLAANYWDEMGRGNAADVHTTLHQRLVTAMGLAPVPWTELPQSALDRSALNGLLATNRWLQPELVGALGLLELQAGPRCRRVVRALRRLDAPAGAYPFYEEHVETDPRHGKLWLDQAVRPLVEAHPEWGPRIVRGARWRAELNRRLFGDTFAMLATVAEQPA